MSATAEARQTRHQALSAGFGFVFNNNRAILKSLLILSLSKQAAIDPRNGICVVCFMDCAEFCDRQRAGVSNGRQAKFYEISGSHPSKQNACAYPGAWYEVNECTETALKMIRRARPEAA
jgi:hypothetical protein